MHVVWLLLITFLTINSVENCVLPDKFNYGTLKVLNNSTDTTNALLDDAQIEISCDEGFKAYPSNITTCLDVATTKSTCIKTCPSVQQQEVGVKTSCQYNGAETPCDNPYAGTTVIFSCDYLYENRNKEDRRAFVCQFGYWDFTPIFKCEPVCGKKFVQATKLIINGEDAKENEYVWHIALFHMRNLISQICGGTIITPKISLSAAHCFVSYKDENDVKDYSVGAGKSYRNFNDARDNIRVTQHRQLSHIILPELYSFQSESRFDYDIAVLVLEVPFKLTEFVLPACLDLNPLFNHDSLVSTNGTVVGWGITEENGKPAERLKMLNVNYVKRENCKLKFDFQKFYFPYVQDKICAGRYNEGKSACKGDSGGGLVFRAVDQRFYLRGIVSIAPKKREQICDSNRYTLYTSVAFHLDFIREQIDKFKEPVNVTLPEVKYYVGGCIIPKIANGRVESRFRGLFPDSNVTTFTIGTPVPNNTVFIIECANGFSPYPENLLTTTCNNGEWSSVECRAYCKPVERDPNADYICYYNDEIVSCDKPFVGTTMQIICHENYIRDFDILSPYTYCTEDGYWSIYANSYCVSTCGLDYVKSRKDIIAKDGPTTSEEFPWHAAIYRKTDQKYLCSGVYGFDNLVLTASSCLESYQAEDLVLGIGKSYLNFFEEKDGQFYGVDEIYNATSLAEKASLTYAPSISFIFLKPNNEYAMNPHRVCDAKFDFKYDRPGFFVTWEDPYTEDRYYRQLQKVQVIIREPAVCNITRSEGVCMEVTGKPICQRVTGGGFVYKDDKGRYNLIAIADRIPKTGDHCNLKYLTAVSVL